jgi:hypothetical protein
VDKTQEKVASMEKYQSITKFLGLPDAFGVVLLMFGLILLLAPYFSGADFGAFKIPNFTQIAKRWLKIIGPILFILFLLIFVPLIPQNVNNAASEKQHIELTIGLSSKAHEQIAEALREFERIINDFSPSPNVSISLNIVELPYDEARHEFLRSNAYDIIMIDDPWVPEYWDNLHPLNEEPALLDYLRTLKVEPNELFGKLFVRSLNQACVDRDKIMGLPILGNVQMAIHRVDTKALIDKNLSDKKSFDEGIDLHGFDSYYTGARAQGSIPLGVRFDVNNDIVETFWEFLRAFGYEDKFEEEVLVIDKSKAEAARDWLNKYASKLSYKDLKAQLLDENPKILIGIGWPSWITTEITGDKSPVLTKIRLHKITNKPVMGVWLLALPKNPLRPDLRNQALRIMVAITADPHFQFFLAQRGIVPVMESFTSTEQLRAIPFWGQNYFEIHDALSNAKPRPRTKQWSRIENEIARQLREEKFQDVPGVLSFRQ